MEVILAVLLVLLLVGLLPTWPYSNSWGYVPSSIVGIVLIILIIFILIGIGIVQ